ncbi:MAG TPA: aspartyl protease family protein [bacterium]
MKTVVLFLALLFCCGGLFAADPVAEIPFRWVMNQIILPVVIEGDTLNFQLDTGANPSLVDLTTAQARGLIVRPARHAPGDESRSNSLDYVAPLRHLNVGGVYIDSIPAMTVDLSLSSRYIGLPLHGVLGYSFFQNRIVQIDYRRHVVRLYDDRPDVDPGRNGVTVPMMMIEGETTPLIHDLTVDGTPLDAGIDTGSSFSFLLFPATVAALGLDNYGANIRADSVLHGESEETDILRGHRATVQIEEMRFNAAAVEFTREGWSSQGTDLWDGALGNAFFRNARLTLDYKNGLISIEL